MLVVEPPGTVVSGKTLEEVVEPPGTVVSGKTLEEVVEPPGTVVPGKVVGEPPGTLEVVEPPGTLVPGTTVVLVGPEDDVLVGPDLVHPSRCMREDRACAAAPRSPTLATAAWSRLQALVRVTSVWAAPTDVGRDQPITRASTTTTPRHGSRKLRMPSVPVGELSRVRSFIPSPPASVRPAAPC